MASDLEHVGVAFEDISSAEACEDHYKLLDAGGTEWASFKPTRESIGDAEIVAPPAIRVSLGRNQSIRKEMHIIEELGAEPLENSPAFIRGCESKSSLKSGKGEKQ